MTDVHWATRLVSEQTLAGEERPGSYIGGERITGPKQARRGRGYGRAVVLRLVGVRALALHSPARCCLCASLELSFLKEGPSHLSPPSTKDQRGRQWCGPDGCLHAVVVVGDRDEGCRLLVMKAQSDGRILRDRL